MIPGIEQHFDRIIAAMRVGLPDGWTSAEFNARFFPAAAVFEAEYVSPDGTAANYQPDADGEAAVRDLRQLFRQAGQPVWSEAWFILPAEGSLKLRFSRVGCDANGDLPYDEAAEAARVEARH